jgi:hypothetical protein
LDIPGTEVVEHHERLDCDDRLVGCHISVLARQDEPDREFVDEGSGVRRCGHRYSRGRTNFSALDKKQIG